MKKILNKALNNKSIFIFDFDGVVVESMSIKGDVFAELFNANSKEKQEIKIFHLRNGSLNRKKKIKFIAQNILKIDQKLITKKYIDKYILIFKKIYQSKYEEIKLIKGIKIFFKKIKKNNGKIYISSSAPKKEISVLSNKFKLINFIDHIYDNKTKKVDALKSIIRKNKTLKKNVIFFGDSESDFITSQKVKVDFCAVMTNKFSKLNKINYYIKLNNYE